MPLADLALIVYLLRAKPADILHLEFEGIGVAICAVAFSGILMWRLIRSLAIGQNPQTQPLAANPERVPPSEPNPAEPRNIQSSSPPEAGMVPAAPVASFPRSIRP